MENTSKSRIPVNGGTGKIIVEYRTLPGQDGDIEVVLMPNPPSVTASGITFINITNSTINIKWNHKWYHYEGCDAFAVLGVFAGTLSLGKTGNFIKDTATECWKMETG
jgi:hypothetical protein